MKIPNVPWGLQQSYNLSFKLWCVRNFWSIIEGNLVGTPLDRAPRLEKSTGGIVGLKSWRSTWSRWRKGILGLRAMRIDWFRLRLRIFSINGWNLRVNNGGSIVGLSYDAVGRISHRNSLLSIILSDLALRNNWLWRERGKEKRFTGFRRFISIKTNRVCVGVRT